MPTKEKDAGVKWFNTHFYPGRRVGRAVRYEDGVLPRLRKDKVVFFTPWGPRYKWKDRGTIINDGDPEVKLLRHLHKMLVEIRHFLPGKEIQWLFLGADLYGTRINRLPAAEVADYFSSLQGWLGMIIPSAEFKLWSEFDADAEPFRTQFRGKVSTSVSAEVEARAQLVSAKLKGAGNHKDYLVERMAEAELIETRYQPIKISAVARHKDAEVDRELPRLYLVPELLHAPWL